MTEIPTQCFCCGKFNEIKFNKSEIDKAIKEGKDFDGIKCKCPSCSKTIYVYFDITPLKD